MSRGLSKFRETRARRAKGARNEPKGPFSVLMADVPWPFEDALPGNGRGAGKHYALLSIPEIMSFPLPPMLPNCVLFFWCVSSMPQEALDVIRAWGFKPKTEIIWRKLTKTGKRWFGMGRTLRAEHERCIIAVRGRPQVMVRNVRSVFDAPSPDLTLLGTDEDGMEQFLDGNGYLFEAAAGRHSAKPEAIYEIIEQLYQGPYVSLFDRRTRKGWKTSGHEVRAEVPYAEQGKNP